MAAVKTLKMVFGLENDKTTTLNLLAPKTGLTLSEVNQASEAMLTKEALIVGGSPIAELKDAYIESYERIELA